MKGGDSLKIFDAIRNIFTKQSKTNRLLVAYGSGQPVWSDIKYESLADEGFSKNPYVYRCINLIAMACGGIPWLVYRKRGKTKRRLDDHPLQQLMTRPNPQQGDTKFIETVISYLLLSGNSYIERVGPRNRPPKELYALRPDRMFVIKGNARQPIMGYEYRVDSQTFQFSPELILHLKMFNPLDDWYGLPPLSAAARSADQSNEAKAWSVAMLQNSARPSGVLKTDESLTDEQFERLKEELEDKYQGRKNAGRPMLLEGGLTWQQISLNPKDMDWLEGQKTAAREIAMVFGVPSELLGDSTNKTYSNYKEARQAFYMETVLPLMDWLRDELNNWLSPLFGDNLYLDYDIDAIEAIQEDRTLVWKRAADAVKAGLLTINEARESMGYETRPDGDILLTPSNLQPNVRDNEEPEMPDQRMIKVFYFCKQLDQQRNRWMEAARQQIETRFNEEREQMFGSIRQASTTEEIGFRIDQAIDNQAWSQLLTAIYRGIMEESGERVFFNLKSDHWFETKQEDFSDLFWTQEALAFVESVVGERVVGITDTTSQQIKEIVAEGIRRGESIDQIAVRIDQLYLEEIIPNRSETIARTETISASNAGSHFGAKATGLNLTKTWVATNDRRTRPSHRRLDGETRDLDERYSNGLLFPGDPTGEPREVIRCRCTQFYSLKGGENSGI